MFFKKALPFNNLQLLFSLLSLYFLNNLNVLNEAIFKNYIYRFGVFNLSTYIAGVSFRKK